MLCTTLLVYDKLSSLSSSDMSDRSVRHVRGTRFGCTRAIVSDIQTIVTGTRPIVPGTRPIIPGIDLEFTGCIDLVPLDRIHRHSDNSFR
jgi:hypothetical protein